MARAAQAVIDEFDELTDLIVAEQGRPRAEVEVMELLAAVETLQWLAEHGPGILAGERIPFSRTQHPVKRGRWSYEPLGVVGVLGPAPEPFATPLGDVAVALMAGNGVVLKPSPHVPLCGERIARVFARAGLPEGLLQRRPRPHRRGRRARRRAASRRSASPARRARGARSARRARAALKRSVLDARRQGRDARAGRRRRRRARCAARRGRRSPTPGSAADRSSARCACPRSTIASSPASSQRRGALRVGDPADPATSIGPLVARERAERVRALVDEAVAAGATAALRRRAAAAPTTRPPCSAA